jgi:hypothetical protein
MTVAKELSKYKLGLMRVQESNGTEVAQNQQANIFVNLCMENRMKILN